MILRKLKTDRSKNQLKNENKKQKRREVAEKNQLLKKKEKRKKKGKFEENKVKEKEMQKCLSELNKEVRETKIF